MSNYKKAMKILAYMARISRYAAINVNVEDIMRVPPAEIDFYYYWCCEAELI